MAEITLYNQDCIAAMKQIDAESIDLIVTEIIIPKWIQDVGKIKMFAFAV